MKCIELTKGQVAIVDDEDFEKLAQYRWYCSNHGYASRQQKNPGGKTRQKQIFMQWLILPPKEGFQIDHKNGNRLDNRRENLRYATLSEQMVNRKKFKNTKTQYKGVYLLVRNGVSKGKFIAAIRKDYKNKYLGLFPTAEEARDAYLKAAEELHGEFTRLN